MKLLLLIGGLLGFAIGLVFSWAEEAPGPACLWHAGLAAYLTALLMRWWGEVWRKSLVESLNQRQLLSEQVRPPSLSKVSKS